MKYRKLGAEGPAVSLICLGTMTWGQQNTREEAFEQLDYALNQGINFVDTAEMYPVPPMAETAHRTETIIGEWFKQRGNRDQVILASKVAGRAPWLPWIRGENGPCLDRKNIEAAIDGSLRRLQTDYIDLYQLHWPDRKTNYFGKLEYEHDAADHSVPIAETLEVLSELLAKGKIRQIGVSNETPWGVHKYLELAKGGTGPAIVSVQNPYSLINRSYEIGLAELGIREQVGLLAYSPLGFGVLSGKYLNKQKPEGARLSLWGHYFTRYLKPQATEATRRYVELARAHDLDPAQMALAWVNSRPFVTSNIIGATSMEQLKANIASEQIALSPEIVSEIQKIHSDIPNPAP